MIDVLANAISAGASVPATPTFTLFMAWTPFIDPLPAAYRLWWLSAIPLLFGISMVYKAYRMTTLQGYWRQVVTMTVQALVAMILFAVVLFVLVLWMVPKLPVE